MAKRFIKLYEQITDWEWFRHPNTLCLFIYLLLKANYKDLDFHGRTIKRGQIVTSLPKIATGTGLTIRQTRTALAHLISTGEVTDESSNQNRIITIVKYDDYQNATDALTGKRQAIDRQLDRQSTDDAAPSIEYIEQIENIEQIEPLTRERKPASRFAPPTKEQIYDFCLENNLGIDVDYLYDYYTAKGWKIGKETMKDWKAAVRNWARRDKKDQPSAKPAPVRQVTGQQYQQRDYSGEQDYWMNRMIADIKGGSAGG